MNLEKDWKLIASIFLVAIVWGTTYLAIRIAVISIPSWFVTGIRQSIAGLILGLYLLFRNEMKWIGWKNFNIQISLSTLMLIIANGLTTMAEEHISSSLTSLLTATAPLIVFILSVIIGIQQFNMKSVIGILIGFSGIVLIFWNGLQDLLNPNYRMGIIILFFAILGWAGGTVLSKKLNISAQNIQLNLFYQFSFAGIVQLLIAFLFTKDYKVNEWTLQSILAVVYLTLFGSIVAFFAFFYALKKVNPTQISMLNYINTIIAIFLGWLILDEIITQKFILAAILIISGVFITNYKKGMFKKKL